MVGNEFPLYPFEFLASVNVFDTPRVKVLPDDPWSLQQPVWLDVKYGADVILFSEDKVLVHDKQWFTGEDTGGVDEHHVGILDCLVDIVLLEVGYLHEVATKYSPFHLVIGMQLVFLQVEVRFLGTLEYRHVEFVEYLG